MLVLAPAAAARAEPASAIAAAALLGWVFARRLVRPIERLRDTAERIARTQDLEVTDPARPAAVRSGASPTSFSTMVDALAVSKRQQQQLVTDASHELRTPLTSLRTNAELLDRADPLNPEQQQRVVQGIRLEVERAHRPRLGARRARDRSRRRREPRSRSRCARSPTTSRNGRVDEPGARSPS